MSKTLYSKLSLVGSMVIFGTVGIFVSYIPLPSGVIAFTRGIIGFLCLLIFAAFSKTKISRCDILANLLLLCLSSAAIGFNWVFLFEAYRHTTVATATLCYYMAPMIVMVASPFVFKEKLSIKKICCLLVALIGMVLISGVIGNEPPSPNDLLGILFGLLAAALYATVIILNKKMKDISAHNRTMVQLGVSAVIVLPYALFAERADLTLLTPTEIILLLCVGVLHTGVAYLFYFGSIKEVPAQTVALFSYIDPAVAIILSAVILNQPMNIISGIGAVLILASSLVSELNIKK